MKLVDLHAKFVQRSMGDSVRIGVTMDCPCGCDSPLYVPFADPDTQCNWTKTGDTIETLTLTPSVFRAGGCAGKWHGHIINGEAKAC